MSFDTLVDPWLDHMPDLLCREIPNAYRIFLRGKRYLDEGNIEKANMCSNLIKLLHNSIVPLETNIGEGVRFGYGGIGVILHKECEIGSYVTIGAQVTLGARRDKGRIGFNGKKTSTPFIGDYVYISSGAKVLGGVSVGEFSIIAPNSVVLKDVPAFSIVGGSPSKILSEITPDNIEKYRATYLPLRHLSDDVFYDTFMSRFSERL
jgi:serine O-acetyltransferase|tara:strand:+ start:5910 stop:6527 length:618 start_codon:yes stop_codon:yes gene_type:complete